MLDTQEKCEAGRCSLDSRLSAAECTSISSCTKQCSKCRSRDYGANVCFDDTVATQEDCNTEDGDWDSDHSKCVFDNFRTQDDCLAAGNGTYTFEQCEDQSIAQCSAMTGMSTFAQTRLQCYANRWDQCETQGECETTGDCDDW